MNKSFFLFFFILIVLSSISYAAKVKIYSLNDSFVYSGSPNLNIGDRQNMDVHNDREVIIRLNTTALPANVNIVSAIFNSSVYNSYVDAGEYSYIGIYEVFKSPLYNWSEYNITWNTRPNSSSHFNQTPESGVNFTSAWSGDVSCTGDWDCMYQWNATKMTKKAYSNNQDLDLYFKVNNSYGLESGDWVAVATGREYGNFYFLEVEYYYNYPTVTLSNPANNSNLYYKDRPFRFNFSTDSGDAITNASLYGNWSGTWQINQTNTSTVTSGIIYNFNLLNLSRGYNYIWNVEVCDIDGNCTFATNNFTFNVLNTIPTVTASITPSPAQATDNLTGTIAYTDLDGDANTINQTLWYNGTVIVSTATNTTFLGSGNLSVGENWIFSARSFDGFEWSAWVNSSTINIGDTTSPIITNSNVTNKSTTIPLNTKVNITAICTDTASSIDWVKFSYASPSSNLTNVSTGNHSGSTYYYEMTLNEKGNWTFNMTWCKDSSGNIDNDTYNYWVYIDDTAPSIINITVDSALYTDEYQNITINCTDLYSPVSSAIVTINSSGILTNYSMSQSGDLWFYATTYGAGTYSTTSFYCQDSSNNLNITQSVNSFTSSTRPSGGDSGGGGGGSIYESQILCNSSDLLWSIRTLYGQTGYNFFIPYDNKKAVEKPIIFTNYGNKAVDITLSCEKTDNNLINICEYVTLSNYTQSIPPNSQESRTVTMFVDFPAGSLLGDVFTFNIKANDKIACIFNLESKATITRFSFDKWRAIYDENGNEVPYPAIIPALIGWFLMLVIGFILFKATKSAFWGIFFTGILCGAVLFFILIWI